MGSHTIFWVVNYGLGLNLHVVTAACSVACLEWDWRISNVQRLFIAHERVLLNETFLAKEVRKGKSVEENS
ncbi:MAG: hypothetical protein RQM92_06455 [Candidatus Syntrophopropionicum ammoniitolerans]